MYLSSNKYTIRRNGSVIKSNKYNVFSLDNNFKIYAKKTLKQIYVCIKN